MHKGHTKVLEKSTHIVFEFVISWKTKQEAYVESVMKILIYLEKNF